MKPTYDEVVDKLGSEIECMESSVYTFSYEDMAKRLIRAMQDMMPEMKHDRKFGNDNGSDLYEYFKTMGR
jgi:hypothetical protein